MSESQKLFEEDNDLKELTEIPTDEMRLIIESLQTQMTNLMRIFLVILLVFFIIIGCLITGLLKLDVLTVLALLTCIGVGGYNIHQGRVASVSQLLLQLILLTRNEKNEDEA